MAKEMSLILLNIFSLRVKYLVVHAFLLSTWEADRGRWMSEFEASLVYRVSSRATQRNPVLKPKKEKARQKRKIIKIWGRTWVG